MHDLRRFDFPSVLSFVINSQAGGKHTFIHDTDHFQTASEAGASSAVSYNSLYACILSGIYRDGKYIFSGFQAVSNRAKLHHSPNLFRMRNFFRSSFCFYRIHFYQVTAFSVFGRNPFTVQNFFDQKQHVIKPMEADRFFLVKRLQPTAYRLIFAVFNDNDQYRSHMISFSHSYEPPDTTE